MLSGKIVKSVQYISYQLVLNKTAPCEYARLEKLFKFT